jgi:hypothetical protein
MDLVLGRGFLRIPNTLFDGLLRTPFNGTEGRVLLWVIRQTYGWNRYRSVLAGIGSRKTSSRTALQSIARA